ncbi:MAG: DUF5694 domain-containing protein [Oligoflexales bacterium]
MNYFNKFKNVRIILLLFCFTIACGDASVKEQGSTELQIALIADFKTSPSLAFNPPQPNLIDSKYSNKMNLFFNRILEFNPNKIFIESIPGSRDCAQINKAFRSYVFNQELIHSFANDVTHQLGFRLAFELGHHQLYCVDADRRDQEKQDQEAMLLLNKNELADIRRDFQHIEKKIDDILADDEPAAAFEFINEVEPLENLRNLRMRLYQSEESKAAQSWQERNRIIVENLKKESSELDDRILVFFSPMQLIGLKYEIEMSSRDNEVLFLKDL